LKGKAGRGGRVRDEKGGTEEEGRRGEPGPVLAPSQFENPTNPSGAEWGSKLIPRTPLGLRLETTIIGSIKLRNRHGANPGSALATMLLDRAFVSSYKLSANRNM